MTAKLYSSHRMAYKRWCFLVFLKSLLVISVSIYDKDLSITHIQEVCIKKLNVAEELKGETLPLKMGRCLYKIHGLKESAWYEVKISYPASIPATFSIALKKKSSDLQVSANRRLLNTEKIVFKFDSKNWNSGEREASVLVTVEPAGIVAKPNLQEQNVCLLQHHL
ncbi:hypothetical protein HPP92_009604 [Vanilla planifolia]|uniref:Uncharacterized protein n=1 Tax=Vanilla planifolia TaxID=51239 RepID=A0A835R4U8_VANPL|nr:hypothetical protein HPP92_009604 [Vanilla planifolia]